MSPRCCAGCGGCAARYGAEPTFLLASATTADPAATAERLTGLPGVAVTEDASPRGPMVFALWEPPLTEHVGEHGAPVRRTATSEAAYLLTDLVADGTRTVAFVRSRRAAELVALQAQDNLDDSLAGRVAAYRGVLAGSQDPDRLTSAGPACFPHLNRAARTFAWLQRGAR